MTDEPGEDAREPPAEAPRRPTRTVSSDELLAGNREVEIVHAGEVYRLRLTRAGKLILHK